MEGQGFNNLDGAFHALMNWQYRYRMQVYNSGVDCTTVPAVGVVRNNADDASGIQAVCVLEAGCCMQLAYKRQVFISCSCLERIGTEYHFHFAAVAVGIVCTVLRVWNIFSSTGFVCALLRSVSSG